MSRLPEKGEALAAIDALRGRANAVVGEASPSYEVGTIVINTNSGSVVGEGAPPMRMIFGDLVDIGDLMTEGGTELVRSAMLSLFEGRNDLASMVASMFTQGVAIGVLMERQRWERGA